MLKKEFVNEDDLKEGAKLERRRQNEELRKQRIFNAKQRLFGQDCDGLNKQVEEKKMAQRAEEEREAKWNAEAQRNAELIRAMEKQLELEKRRRRSDLYFYRSHHQKKEDSRDYDLDDPKNRTEAARNSDNDPRLGISSAQVFMGEDLLSAERKKLQKQQLKAWLEQQMKEKRQAEADRNHADELAQKSMNSRDEMAKQMSSMERANAIRMQTAVLDYNRKLAQQQNCKKEMAKRCEEEDNKAEIYNMVTSDMLTQNPDVAQSHLGLHRKIPFEYRGMSAEELEHFKKEQLRQVEERKQTETDEKLKDKMWEQMDSNITRECILRRLEETRQKKQKVIDLRAENARLAAEQKAKIEYTDKVLYSNECTREFFEQFNKTSR